MITTGAKRKPDHRRRGKSGFQTRCNHRCADETTKNARWAAITEDHRRALKLGGAQSDGARIAALLADIGVTFDAVRRQLASPSRPDGQQELSASLRATIASRSACRPGGGGTPPSRRRSPPSRVPAQ